VSSTDNLEMGGHRQLLTLGEKEADPDGGRMNSSSAYLYLSTALSSLGGPADRKLRHASHIGVAKKNEEPAGHGGKRVTGGRSRSTGLAPHGRIGFRRSNKRNFVVRRSSLPLFVLDDSPNSTTCRSLPAGHESVKVR
jgi:hypothetical protein